MEFNCKKVVTMQKKSPSFYVFCTTLPQILPAVEFLLSGFESRMGGCRLFLIHPEGMIGLSKPR